MTTIYGVKRRLIGGGYGMWYYENADCTGFVAFEKNKYHRTDKIITLNGWNYQLRIIK